MFLSLRTWTELTVAVAVLWLLAEVQDSDGWRATLFDVIWVASLLGFVLLVVLGDVSFVASRRSRAV
jgi:hypothetical protein